MSHLPALALWNTYGMAKSSPSRVIKAIQKMSHKCTEKRILSWQIDELVQEFKDTHFLMSEKEQVDLYEFMMLQALQFVFCGLRGTVSY